MVTGLRSLGTTSPYRGEALQALLLSNDPLSVRRLGPDPARDVHKQRPAVRIGCCSGAPLSQAVLQRRVKLGLVEDRRAPVGCSVRVGFCESPQAHGTRRGCCVGPEKSEEEEEGLRGGL